MLWLIKESLVFAQTCWEVSAEEITIGRLSQWSFLLASTLGMFVGLLGGSRGGGCFFKNSVVGLLQSLFLFLFLFHGRHLTATKCLASITKFLTALPQGCLETRRRGKEKEVTERCLTRGKGRWQQIFLIHLSLSASSLLYKQFFVLTDLHVFIHLQLASH